MKKEKEFYGEICDKPQIEQDLFSLQEKYLKTKKYEYWQEMFSLCQVYSKSMILKRNKGKRFISPDEIEESATSTALAFMKQYFTSENFKVMASFAGMIKWKILEVLYGQSQDDSNISLNSSLGDDEKNETQDISYTCNFNNFLTNENYHDISTSIFNTSANEIIKEICSELYEETRSSIITFKVQILLSLYLRNPKNRNAKKNYIQYAGTDEKTKKIFDLSILEFYKRLKEVA